MNYCLRFLTYWIFWVQFAVRSLHVILQALMGVEKIGAVYASLYLTAHNEIWVYFLHILRHLDKNNWLMKKPTQVPTEMYLQTRHIERHAHALLRGRQWIYIYTFHVYFSTCLTFGVVNFQAIPMTICDFHINWLSERHTLIKGVNECPSILPTLSSEQR